MRISGINCIRQKKAAVTRYLATVEGKILLTNLVAEVANSYYELQALDNPLIVKQNIALQKSALEIVKLQKKKARERAVQKFKGGLEIAKHGI
jgi:hypothetical protein